MSGFDIHIEPATEVQGTRCLTFGAYPHSIGVKGVQKMVNRFVMCFLTPQGSHRSDPDYGTPLAGAIANTTDARSLRALAAQSVVTAEQKIREYDMIYGLPDDERLRSVEIQNIVVDPTGLGVVLYLLLRNAAGTTVQVLLPQTLGS